MIMMFKPKPSNKIILFEGFIMVIFSFKIDMLKIFKKNSIIIYIKKGDCLK